MTAAHAAPAPAPASIRTVSRRRAVGLAALADRDLGSRSEAELIAQVLAGPEPAAQILDWGARLARVPFWQRRALGAEGLVADYGLPTERAVRLAALWELAERWYPDDRPAITSARDAVLLLGSIRDSPREQVAVILLDARHRPMGFEVVAVGTLNASRLSPRDVLAPALRADAAGVILAHNHPSGEPTPSRADHVVTEAVRRGGDLIGIPILDHVIVAHRGHFSFRDTERWTDQ